MDGGDENECSILKNLIASQRIVLDVCDNEFAERKRNNQDKCCILSK